MTGRRFMIVAGLAALIGFSSPALAQPPSPLVIDLSQNHVDITTGFAGSSFVVYGRQTIPGDVAIIIRGPDQQMVVRRKDQVGGIWMNSESIAFDNVPIYYDLAVSRPEQDMAPRELLQKYDIGLDALEFQTREDVDETNVHAFREALIRNRQVDGLFPLESGRVTYLADGFFRAAFHVPPDVPTGSYRVQAYLIQNGQIADIQNQELRVAQKGFSAGVYSFAHDHSLAYGVAAVLLAAFAGWAAWATLRRE